jgi:opacity protein-like surface antigen
MKSRLLLALLLLVPVASSGQFIRAFGVKAGAALASQTWDYAASYNDLSTESRWGIDAGIYVEWLTIPVFSVSSEVHYIQKGMKFSVLLTSEQSPEGWGEYRTFLPRVDYLSTLLLAKARLLDGEISPYIVVGPRVDFLLQDRGEGFELVLDKFRDTDVGVTIGAGVEVKSFNLLTLGAEFRYSPSLNDGYSSAFLNVRNSSLEFLLVVGF